MKKKGLILAVILFFSLLPVALFSSCDKDTNCYLDVLVLDEANRNPVSGVNIEVMQNGGTVHDEGITGNDGIYSTKFVAPAILTIKAVLFMDNGAKRRGETSVRIVEGETKTATITLPAKVVYD